MLPPVPLPPPLLLLLLLLLQLSLGSGGDISQQASGLDGSEATAASTAESAVHAGALPPSYSGPGGAVRREAGSRPVGGAGGRSRHKAAGKKRSRSAHSHGNAQLPRNGLDLVRQWWAEATAYNEAGRFVEASALWLNIAELLPADRPEAAKNLAVSYERRGLYFDALSVLELVALARASTPETIEDVQAMRITMLSSIVKAWEIAGVKEPPPPGYHPESVPGAMHNAGSSGGSVGGSMGMVGLELRQVRSDFEHVWYMADKSRLAGDHETSYHLWAVVASIYQKGTAHLHLAAGLAHSQRYVEALQIYSKLITCGRLTRDNEQSNAGESDMYDDIATDEDSDAEVRVLCQGATDILPEAVADAITHRATLFQFLKERCMYEDWDSWHGTVGGASSIRASMAKQLREEVKADGQAHDHRGSNAANEPAHEGSTSDDGALVQTQQ